MAVEPRYAAAVEALLQSLRARDRGAALAPTPDEETGRTSGGRRRRNGGGVVWSADDYDAFMAAAKESYRRVRAFGAVLAASPGQELTTTAACEAAGITRTQLRAALGKFTTWMKATTDNDEWPFGWEYGEDVDASNPGEFHYSMNEDQAAAWKTACQRTPEPPQ
jgi:hypothetical protein